MFRKNRFVANKRASTLCLELSTSTGRSCYAPWLSLRRPFLIVAFDEILLGWCPAEGGRSTTGIACSGQWWVTVRVCTLVRFCFLPISLQCLWRNNPSRRTSLHRVVSLCVPIFYVAFCRVFVSRGHRVAPVFSVIFVEIDRCVQAVLTVNFTRGAPVVPAR